MPITQLANITNIIQSTMASAERIFELLDEQEEIPEAVDAPIIENPQGACNSSTSDLAIKKMPS